MIAVRVEELASTFKVRFAYNASAVAQIKTIPGSQWRKELGNAWLIPKTSVRALERFLAWASGTDTLKKIERPSGDPSLVYPTRSKGAPPWQHQLAAFRYLWNRQASLIDLVPGSGKSRIFVDFCLNAPEMRRALIMCPKSFVQGWRAQFEKHGGSPIVCACLDSAVGTVRERVQAGLRALREAQERGVLAVIVTNYDVCWYEAEQVVAHTYPDASPAGYHYKVHVPDADDPVIAELFVAHTWDEHEQQWTLQADGLDSLRRVQAYWKEQISVRGPAYAMADFLLDAKFDVVAYDECHRLRGHNTRVSRFAYKLSASVPIRIGLSGKPFPETRLDSFGVSRALDASVLGTSYYRFRSRYAEMGGFGNYQVTGFKNQDELRTKINTLRFTMEPEGYELPPEQDITIPLILPEKVQRLYKKLETELYAKIVSGEIYLANAAVAFSRLHQVCSGVIPVDNPDTRERKLTLLHTCKQDALADLLDSLPAEQSIVVICRFHYDLAAVHTVAKEVGRVSAEVSGRSGRPQAHLNGGVWVGPETVLAVQGSSGVEGLDLTRAHIMCYYSYVLELGKYMQSRARIRRAGQTQPCTFYHLVVQGGIDQKIRRLLERKEQVLQGLLGDRCTPGGGTQ
jgi:hypothetical protein